MFGTGKSAKFLRMALSAAFFAYLAVVFGAYSRLSEAALGCPDWPSCAGRWYAPVTAQDHNEAQTQPSLKVPHNRAWKDMVSRYIAGALGLVLIRLAVLGWQLKKRKRSQQILIPSATLVVVFALVVVGLLTIDLQFKPLIMMTQLLGGMLILSLLWWIVLREQRFWRSVNSTPTTRPLRLRALVALALVALQFTLGGWSMVNYAGLACPDFPTCQAEYWPPMDFVEGLTLWRDVGVDYESGLLNLPAATAIHMAHRVGAVITTLYVGWLSLHVLRVGNDEHLCRYGLLVAILLSLGVTLGIMDVVTRFPVAVAVAHNAVAALLLLSLVTLYHVVRSPRAANA